MEDSPPGGPRSVVETVRAAVGAHGARLGPLLPVLQQVQAEHGCVDSEAIRAVAAALNLSRADVHGVVSFYPDLRPTPAGRAVIRICRAEACQSVGAEGLLGLASHELGVPVGGTTADGAATLDEVFCLGNCALGPTVQVGDRLHGRVTATQLHALLDEVVER